MDSKENSNDNGLFFEDIVLGGDNISHEAKASRAEVPGGWLYAYSHPTEYERHPEHGCYPTEWKVTAMCFVPNTTKEKQNER